MENNEIIKYEGGLIKRVSNAISVTNKLLALTEPQLIPYRKKDKWGFCTPDKKIVIDCVYDNSYFFFDGLALIKLSNKWAFIDIEGKEIISLHVLIAPDWNELGDVIINELHNKVGDRVFKETKLATLENKIAYWEFESPHDGILLYIAGDKGDKILSKSCIAIIGKASKAIQPSIFQRVKTDIITFNTCALFSDYGRIESLKWNELKGKERDIDKNGVEYWEN